MCGMNHWITDYVKTHKATLDSIPADGVAQLIEKLRVALKEDRQIFVFGNGGSAANASHFATDLGKGSSDKLGKRFRVLSLNDNVGWMTALGNDYSYEDVFVGQLQNYGKAGDLVLSHQRQRQFAELCQGAGVVEGARAAYGRAGRAPSGGAWRKLPTRRLSSMTRTTGGSRTRRWASATSCATRSWKNQKSQSR